MARETEGEREGDALIAAAAKTRAEAAREVKYALRKEGVSTLSSEQRGWRVAICNAGGTDALMGRTDTGIGFAMDSEWGDSRRRSRFSEQVFASPLDSSALLANSCDVTSATLLHSPEEIFDTLQSSLGELDLEEGGHTGRSGMMSLLPGLENFVPCSWQTFFA